MAAVVRNGRSVIFENRNHVFEQNMEKTHNEKNGYVKSSAVQNGMNKSNFYKKEDVAIDEADSFEQATLLTVALTQMGLYFLMFLGFVNQLFFKPKSYVQKNREGYAPLYNPFETFYSNYVYRRVRHVFNRPICSTPGAELVLKERTTDDYNWSFRFTGTQRRCINLGSYNYLGFASGTGECAEAAAAAVRKYGVALASSRLELGTCALHTELEHLTAQFLGVEDAIVFGMGFATNSLSLPCLFGPGTLVLSDEKNHASLILGLKLSRATLRVFRHNDLHHLEQLVRQARMQNTFRNIIVVVEGVYSMEGSIVPLAGLVALKKRYKLQIYLDEAHSVGALGPRGRGVTDLTGVSPADVDVLMGTFTKSFGAAGGYIAGSRSVVQRVRAQGHAHTYAHSMAPAVSAQVLAAMRAVAQRGGRARLLALRDNAYYFRQRLRSMGVIVLGAATSPVVPMLVYSFSKMQATVERLADRGVAVVGVGFPATPLNNARIRFCLSAAHTPEHLYKCLQAIEEVVDELGLRYSQRPRPPPPPPLPQR